MKNEIVQYGNSINNTALKGLKAGGLDLFMALCTLARDKGTDLLVIDYTTMKKMTGLSDQSNEYAAKQYGKAAEIINSLRFAVHNEETGKARFVTLFPTCDNDPDTETITIRVNPDAKSLLNDIENNFTKFELGQFISLESKYSKNLFRLLKQYRRTGTYKVESGKFRELMDCPEKYRNREFMKECINVAVKELSRGYFDNLTVIPIHGIGRGRPIESYKFTFKRSKDVPGQYNLSDYDPDTEKPEKPKKAATNKNNRFNNFTQRQYDYDDLEKKLLAAQDVSDK